MYNVYYIFSTDENYPRYVGISANNVFRRLGEHISRPTSKEFEAWIDGKLSNNVCISSKVITTAETKTEAETIERFWIKYFSRKFHLYNKDHNSKYVSFTARKVVKADKVTNKILSVFDNAEIAAHSVNGLKCEIVNVCNQKNYLFKGFRWYWHDKYDESYVNSYNAPNLSKKILRIEKATGIKKQYDSITLAARDLNLSISTISNWLHKKNGCKLYDWEILSTNIIGNQGRLTTYLKVLKLDENGNLIEEIENIKKYCKDNKMALDSIYHAMSTNKIYKNFLWKKIALISSKGRVLKTYE